MEDLIKKLNYYTEAYDKGQPLISDTEWDKIYFELVDKPPAPTYYFIREPTFGYKHFFIKPLE